ncbi:TIGR02594 family protein [Rhizobium mayense]|uniref:TIGR02594 family protein n=1 Tax=Rhizobium mayense TaxID=1312184 RepID=A0ABT7JY92_9HYPH|nr:TIGR02594 family protein [Rhizobium mayense]MDL2401272.1 TIGR02594 family protein [Rhizobium mayense]
MQSFDEWLAGRLAIHGHPVSGAGAKAVSVALMAFQSSIGLAVTGTANADTVAALRKTTDQVTNISQYQAVPVAPTKPSWMREAERLIGLHEGVGAANNPTIIGWAKKLGGWISSYYTQDSTPWCGLFQAHCIGAALPTERLPDNPLGALNWATFGRALQTPAPGAILVFKRTGGGHVTQYYGENETHFCCLGGNQSDAVTNDDWVPKERLVAIRWPLTGEAPVGGRMMLTANHTPSAKEA